MSETMSLHIQASESDSGPIRVVELSGSSVRIGRSPSCEVQIADPALAHEQCVLRRRGNGWLLVPVGPPGAVWIDGRAVDRGQLLPLDAPFRVGDHWLTLHRSDVAADGWGSFRTPIPVGMRPSPAPASAGLRAEGAEERERKSSVAGEGSPPEGSGPESEAERLSRWEALREQRQHWRGAREEEKRWEERWRAAGESLRVRSGTQTSRLVTSPLPPSPRERVPGGRVRGPGSDKGTPLDAPPRPIPRVAAPSTRPAVHRDRRIPPRAPVVDPRPPEAPSPGSPHEQRARPRPWDEFRDPAPVSSEVAAIADALLVEPIPATLEPLAPVALPVPRSIPQEDAADSDGVPAGEEVGEVSVIVVPVTEAPAPAIEAPSVDRAGALSEPEPLTRPPGTLSRGERGIHEEGRIGDEPIRFETSSEPVLWSSVNQAPFVTDTTFAEPRDWQAPPSDGASPVTPPASTRPMAVESAPPSPPRCSPEWPSAQSILAMHREMRGRCTPARPQGRPASARPIPTVGQEPGHWKVPLWLGWVPLVATTTLAGVVGLPMAWTWAADDRAAGIVADRLASPAPGPQPPLEVTEPADTRWWKTTAGNLVQWAMYRDRAEGDPRRTEVAWELMSEARRVSPLHAAARFASARPIASGAGPAPLVQSLGLSRDVIALAWTGHQLLKAGKKDAAARAYHSALVMASEADLVRLPEPAFNDDRQVDRYALPCEDLIGEVVGEMASCGEWTFEEWSKCLPPRAIVRLVAARVLRERGDADAERALDAVLAGADAPAEGGPALALHLAAQAEALALRSQWKDAKERYQRAVELMPDGSTRRSWYVNLADLELRLNDEPKRRSALEAARGLARNDEITRRVNDLLKAFGGRAEITTRPAPAENP